MKNATQLNQVILSTKSSYLCSPQRRGLLLTALTIAFLALSFTAGAVSPPPDGGYANQTTAEGNSALFSLTTGFDNTAIGFEALFSNTTGNDNIALGDGALFANTTGSDNVASGSFALLANTTGAGNTATGFEALLNNTTGGNNTAHGCVYTRGQHHRQL